MVIRQKSLVQALITVHGK